MRPTSKMDDASGGSLYAAEFTSALLSPGRPAPAVVAGPSGKAVTKRYGVYRNNVTVSLINALAAIFPATQRITGLDFFREMARTHVRTTPPSSPLLFEYGRDFPDFIGHYEHAKSLPWLADVARVERAWLDAYHAADAVPLALATLATIPPEQLTEVRLAVHPATRIVRSHYSALAIFSANRVDEPVPQLDASAPEDTLITRPKLEVMARQLPPGGATFLNDLIGGEPLGAAAGAALDEAGTAFDLGANIAGMIEAGVFVGISGGLHDVD